MAGPKEMGRDDNGKHGVLLSHRFSLSTDTWSALRPLSSHLTPRPTRSLSPAGLSRKAASPTAPVRTSAMACQFMATYPQGSRHTIPLML